METTSKRIGRILRIPAIAACLGSYFLGYSALAAIPVVLSNAPESNLSLTVKAIANARRSILVNAYELNSPPVVQMLEDKIKQGVQVVVLKEGQPVGGLSQADKDAASTLCSAMQSFGNDRFFLMQAPRAERRFVFDHAKYMVFDGQAVLVGSENYAPGGQTEPGTLGNRGWQALVNDARLADVFTGIFRGDTDTSHGDVHDITHASFTRVAIPQLPVGPGGGVPMMADAVDPLFSPQTSLSGTLALLNSARQSIDVEQMSMTMVWKDRNSPIVDALVAAAARGVRVRIILNDDAESFHKRPPNNWDIARSVNQIAAQRNLPLSAKVANLRRMGVKYIHNKGVLVDGNRTLISSINWTMNSVMNNRESAVVLQGSSVNAYYQNLYNNDWAQ